MNQIPVQHYAVIVQTVHHHWSGEYAVLALEATSREDAEEALRGWCRMKEAEDAALEDLLPASRYEVVEGSLQEFKLLDTRKETLTAWAAPARARCARRVDARVRAHRIPPDPVGVHEPRRRHKGRTSPARQRRQTNPSVTGPGWSRTSPPSGSSAGSGAASSGPTSACITEAGRPSSWSSHGPPWSTTYSWQTRSGTGGTPRPSSALPTRTSPGYGGAPWNTPMSWTCACAPSQASMRNSGPCSRSREPDNEDTHPTPTGKRMGMSGNFTQPDVPGNGPKT